MGATHGAEGTPAPRPRRGLAIAGALLLGLGVWMQALLFGAAAEEARFYTDLGLRPTTAIGMVAFGLFFLVLPKLLPFSLKKEMEEDQNIALGIVIGSIVIGMAIIIGHAIGS